MLLVRVHLFVILFAHYKRSTTATLAFGGRMKRMNVWSKCEQVRGRGSVNECMCLPRLSEERELNQNRGKVEFSVKGKERTSRLVYK